MEKPETIRSYRDLLAWRKARELVSRVYRATGAFPEDERYGLTSQIRRSAVSVPSNIAEGYGRGSPNDYVRFLQTARGSLYELQTQLLLATDLGYLDGTTSAALSGAAEECARILHGLIVSVKAKTR